MTPANQAPDEIISEIISPLLRHPDEAFSKHPEEALLEAGYSSSTYLLVCKAWLRVSTPLLYTVVILRTTAQAVALAKVLAAHPAIGLLVKKLRVEGGYGSAMRTILAQTPNITDLFISLVIHSSDNVRGLCSGLPLISPRRVILFDVTNMLMPSGWGRGKPKTNKAVTALLEALVANIPKWDKLKIFELPYFRESSQGTPRAHTVTSALTKSPNLHTLILPAGPRFPDFVRKLVDLPSFKSLQFLMCADLFDMAGELYDVVNADPKLRAVVTYRHISESLATEVDHDSSSLVPPTSSARAHDVATLTTLGETLGNTLQELCVKLSAPPDLARSRIPVLALESTILTPFTSLTHLTWWADDPKLSFTDIPPGFSALPNLKSMTIQYKSPSIFEIGLRLSLKYLQEVTLNSDITDVPAAFTFLKVHGSKLIRLSAPLETLVKIGVFNLCTSLTHLTVLFPFSKSASALKNDFLSSPHTAIARITFDLYSITPQQESTFEEIFGSGGFPSSEGYPSGGHPVAV
ncbi:hypothetical protein C8R46DRAFT_1001750 [Mycena filopes]|nr:hypothetical protein C8R46DRAFT_1001750 [Mycena filopes]